MKGVEEMEEWRWKLKIDGGTKEKRERTKRVKGKKRGEQSHTGRS